MCGCGKNKEVKDKDKDKDVLVLTDNNFKDAIKKHRNILVQFYAPWCGYCKSLAPEYAKAAGILAADGSSFKLAKVDATVEKTLSKDFGIRGFPTMKYFVKGKLKSEYNGTRDAAGIVAWAKKKSVSATVNIKKENKNKEEKEEKSKK
jgi:protein disulfide-isomerase A1